MPHKELGNSLAPPRPSTPTYPHPVNDTASICHRVVRFQGRVQGVGFRATTRDIARRHTPIEGFVRNEPDGSVLLHAQGQPDRVERFINDLSTTMDRYITTAETRDQPADPDLGSFRIES